MKRFLAIPALLVTAFSLFTMSFLFPFHNHQAFAATGKNTISPNNYVCPAGWAYDSATRTHYHQFQNVVTGTRYDNHTLDNISYTSTFSGTHSKSASVSGSIEGGWGPINATVGYSADTSFSWTSSEAVTVTVRPKYEGWNDYGVSRDVWSGTYQYTNSTCGTSSAHNVTVYTPRYKTVSAQSAYIG